VGSAVVRAPALAAVEWARASAVARDLAAAAALVPAWAAAEVDWADRAAAARAEAPAWAAPAASGILALAGSAAAGLVQPSGLRHLLRPAGRLPQRDSRLTRAGAVG